MENDILSQIKAELTAYGKSLGRVGQLRLVGIVSRVLGLFLLLLTIVLCVLALFTFGAIAAIDALATCMPVWMASLVIGCAYLLLIAVAILCRKPLFINLFIRLLSKQIASSEEELAIKTLEAEHEAQTQRVRLTCRAESATRELNFYANLLSRGWSLIKGFINRKS